MHYNNESFSYSFMIIISKVMTSMKHVKKFQIACTLAVCCTQLMALAQSWGAALNKGFAYIEQHGGNSGFRSKVGVRL